MSKLIPLDIPPGLYRNGTDYEVKGRWFDANLIRFTDKTVKPIGGWMRMNDNTESPIAALTGVPRGMIAWRGITGDPYIGVGTTSKLYAISGGSNHDITPAGFVAGSVDTAPVSGGSGSYGNGPYGSGFYGSGATTVSLREADTWQLDMFGNYMVGVDTKNQKLYVWQGDGATPAASQDFSGAVGAPTTATGVVMTPERFLVLLGVGGNVRRVIWASQGTYTIWNPLAANSAGDWDLKTLGRLMTAKSTVNETLLWTDVDVHTMTYIGGDLKYRFKQVGDKCGVISRRAVAMIGSQAFWMGRTGFFTYDGFVRAIPSEVHDYVFTNLNVAQAAKIWATSTTEHGEITWYYCSGSQIEIDSYVTYNYFADHWTFGKLSRTAGVDSGAVKYPVMATAAGLLYEHEVGQDHSGVAPYVESGPAEIGEGDRLMYVDSIVPDEKTLGDVSATFYTRLFPNGAETVVGPFTFAEPQPISVRFEARQARVRLQEVRPVNWRVGIMRFGVIPSSYR